MAFCDLESHFPTPHQTQAEHLGLYLSGPPSPGLNNPLGSLKCRRLQRTAWLTRITSRALWRSPHVLLSLFLATLGLAHGSAPSPSAALASDDATMPAAPHLALSRYFPTLPRSSFILHHPSVICGASRSAIPPPSFGPHRHPLLSPPTQE
ncbi:hypothetical protein HYPSUDRAFT_206790 [Hypholoma sublateritium FD-334 SS-4]|uniref:Uncharacterized protein n=1 Tax=Hypholoma sublateritium (strain FD-334 SS-4) TaxID=945553 RepID=A0A0D2KQA6_HYPSF|nr:hypothetical protein HYPSUDRAFT_206790 [Hypholoma sublateritium FD-334 SS-4]